MLTNQSIGYMDAPIPKGLDLKEEINRMRKEKNAVILAHYYQTGDIQDIADFVGDSLALAQQAAKTTADIIVSAVFILWVKRQRFCVRTKSVGSGFECRLLVGG